MEHPTTLTTNYTPPQLIPSGESLAVQRLSAEPTVKIFETVPGN